MKLKLIESKKQTSSSPFMNGVQLSKAREPLRGDTLISSR